MREPMHLGAVWGDPPEWGGRYSFSKPPEPGAWPPDESEYVHRRGLLVPKRCVVQVWTDLVADERDRHPSTKRKRGPVAASLRAVVEITAGVPEIQELEVRRARVSPELLSRIPVRDLANRAAALWSLTDRPETQYRVARGADIFEWFGSLHAYRSPWPVEKIPLPDLTDSEGRPWWRVVLDESGARTVDKFRRPKRGPEFYADVLRARDRARDEGRRDTTQAVRDWAELEYGKRPATQTARKWIADAKKARGSSNAED